MQKDWSDEAAKMFKAVFPNFNVYLAMKVADEIIEHSEAEDETRVYPESVAAIFRKYIEKGAK